MSRLRFVVAGSLTGLAMLAGACRDSALTESASYTIESASSVPRIGAATLPNLLVCPPARATSASFKIGPNGGSFSLAGHSIFVPAGAVRQPVMFNINVPAAPVVVISVTASGADHFTFKKPVSIALSYARCSRPSLASHPLSVWHLDDTTGWLLEYMGGVDDKSARTVSFQTNHLSTYAISY